MSNLSSTPANRKGNGSPGMPDDQQRTPKGTIKQFTEEAGDDDSDDDEGSSKPEKRAGRRKIKIEYIDDKSRRHITFSKRKAGIMKKAYELSTLTGTQVLLLVVSETGLVYTFTTPKLQPLVTKPEGKNLIQACLNAPDNPSGTESPQRTPQQPNVYNDNSAQVESNDQLYDERKQHSSSAYNPSGLVNYNSGGYNNMPSQMPLNQGYTTMNSAYPNQSNYLYNAPSQYMQSAPYAQGLGGYGNNKFPPPSQEKK